MQTVCELQSFRRSAEKCGMTECEISSLVSLLGGQPMAGVEISGTGGCRKLRVSMPGMGKSGGYRVVTFYSGETMPVFLVFVFAKGMKANLSEREKSDLKKITAMIVSEYKARVVPVKQAGTVA